MELPSQADYPDYYQLIKQPIALDIIKVIPLLIFLFYFILFYCF